jgi:hypothetical protein
MATHHHGKRVFCASSVMETHGQKEEMSEKELQVMMRVPLCLDLAFQNFPLESSVTWQAGRRLKACRCASRFQQPGSIQHWFPEKRRGCPRGILNMVGIKSGAYAECPMFAPGRRKRDLNPFSRDSVATMTSLRVLTTNTNQHLCLLPIQETQRVGRAVAKSIDQRKTPPTEIAPRQFSRPS